MDDRETSRLVVYLPSVCPFLLTFEVLWGPVVVVVVVVVVIVFVVLLIMIVVVV